MRQFVLERNPDSKGCVSVEGKKYHYLSAVLRVSPGDMIYARLPGGQLQQMTVAKIDSGAKKIILQVAGNAADSSKSSDGIKAAPISEQSGAELWLFMFAAKPPKMDLVIRQAVECGVSFIVPVKGTFCQKSSIDSAEKKSAAGGSDDRWNRIIVEAMEQSGSPVATKVLPCVSVQEACDLWNKRCSQLEKQQSLALVLYEQTAGTKSLHEAAKNADSIKAAAVAVGAEGGVSPEEVELMQNNGFIPVHFATNILRCETAALYGIAALQTVLMENELWQFRE